MKTKFLLPLACLCLAGCVTATHTVTRPPPGPTLAEVQSMIEAHVGDTVIVNQIQNSSSRYTLTADQIIALKNAGASDAVLNALITSVNKAPVEITTTADYDPYVYPYMYVDPWPWPWFWWGWRPSYYGGYYHGYYHGGGYHGGYYHGGSLPHGGAPHGGPPSGGQPRGSQSHSGGHTR